MPQPALFDLKGKRALITGSSRGLGLAMAEALGDAGADIILNGRDTHQLGAAAKTLGERGANVTALAFDISSIDSITAAIDYAENDIGPIDILINNAGHIARGPLLDFPADKLDRMMQLNVDALLHVSQAVAPHMIARGSGKIINIGSTAGKLARAGNIPYSASKAAVDSLTKGMAAEWGPLGINVNAIAPGLIGAGMNSDVLNDKKLNDFIAERVPLARWGQPQDIVGAAIFLSSPAASFVNGHTLVVDGGLTATL